MKNCLFLILAVTLFFWSAIHAIIPQSLLDGSIQEYYDKNYYHLRIGDTLIIKLYGEDDTKRKVIVNPDGTISYLFINNIRAMGKTIQEIRKTIEEELKSYYRNPIVMISAVSFVGEYYTILGEVINTGIKDIKGNTTILSALAEGGGFEIRIFRDQTIDIVDFDHSFIARNGECLNVDFQQLIEGDTSQDIKLQSGDYIYIAKNERQEIHVLGEVGTPDSIEYMGRTTLGEMLAYAGGLTERASSRVAVIRGSLAHPVQFLIDVNLILKGRAPDFNLLPGDIVYVPPRQFTTLREIVREGINNFVGEVANQAGFSAFVATTPKAAGDTAAQPDVSFSTGNASASVVTP